MPITIVSGLPRSGTSLMMQMLERGGLPLLTDDHRAPDESNPRGYFEFEPVKHLRTDRSWLARAEGRAVKIIHLLLRELPTDGTFSYRVILLKRPIQEILASQQTMLERQGKTSASAETLTRVYTSQMAEVEAWLSAQPSFSVLPVAHGHLLADPLRAAAEINEFLDGTMDVAAMASAVDPQLHRQRTSD